MVVDKSLPLSEVLKWDLEDIEKMNALMDMQLDYETARTIFQEEEGKKK